MFKVINKIKITLLFFVISLTSCLQDKCGHLKCENGICVDGQCVCQFGFEGEFCDEPWYEKFLGTWNVEETKTNDTTNSIFQIDVQFSRVVDTVKISGFAKTWGDIYCVRENSTAFKMLETEIDSTTKLVSGEGSIDNTYSKVTGVYSFTKDGQDTVVNFTWNK